MTGPNVPTDQTRTSAVCLQPTGHDFGFGGRSGAITVAVTALGVPAEQSALLVANAWPEGAEEAEIWVRVCGPCVRRARATHRVSFPPTGDYRTRYSRRAPLVSKARL